MSSDNARLRPTPGFKPSGVGLYMTWTRPPIYVAMACNESEAEK